MKPNRNPPANWPKTPSVHPPRSCKGTILTVLGCGTSTGVPILGCTCRTCQSRDPKNKRTRASVSIQVNNRVFLIDTSPDLRLQAFRHKMYWIDAVLYTHPHADHIHGIDELRTFNFIMARRMPCYGNQWTIDSIHSKFDYIFKYTQEGGGKPQIDTVPMSRTRMISGVRVIPLELIHGSLPVLGYRINDVADITDCSYVPERTI